MTDKSTNQAGKGDTYRPVNRARYEANMALIRWASGHADKTAKRKSANRAK